jgi:hypothetical protein
MRGGQHRHQGADYHLSESQNGPAIGGCGRTTGTETNCGTGRTGTNGQVAGTGRAGDAQEPEGLSGQGGRRCLKSTVPCLWLQASAGAGAPPTVKDRLFQRHHHLGDGMVRGAADWLPAISGKTIISAMPPDAAALREAVMRDLTRLTPGWTRPEEFHERKSRLIDKLRTMLRSPVMTRNPVRFINIKTALPTPLADMPRWAPPMTPRRSDGSRWRRYPAPKQAAWAGSAGLWVIGISAAQPNPLHNGRQNGWLPADPALQSTGLSTTKPGIPNRG